MELVEALHILADIHTRDDDRAGFVVVAGAQWLPYVSPWMQEQYVEAWKVVRQHAGFQTERVQ